MSDDAIETVLAWHAALNAGEVARLLRLSADDVEVGGPRGAGRGAHLLEDWAARAGMRMQPGRLFHRDGVVVVEASAQWRTEDGGLTDPQSAACVFRVRSGRVDSIVRHADVASALAAAGLDESDAAR
jgi:hypothetical protein